MCLNNGIIASATPHQRCQTFVLFFLNMKSASSTLWLPNLVSFFCWFDVHIPFCFIPTSSHKCLQLHEANFVLSISRSYYVLYSMWTSPTLLIFIHCWLTFSTTKRKRWKYNLFLLSKKTFIFFPEWWKKLNKIIFCWEDYGFFLE